MAASIRWRCSGAMCCNCSCICGGSAAPLVCPCAATSHNPISIPMLTCSPAQAVSVTAAAASAAPAATRWIDIELSPFVCLRQSWQRPRQAGPDHTPCMGPVLPASDSRWGSMCDLNYFHDMAVTTERIVIGEKYPFLHQSLSYQKSIEWVLVYVR